MTWSRIARRIRVPAGFAVAALYLWLAQPTLASLCAGGAIVAAGLLLRAAASGHITKNAALTTTGPYAHTRNPLYLGSMIMAAGFTIAALSWWVVVALAVLFLGVYLPVIRAEEEYLRAHFPEFEVYSRQVPLLWPRLRKLEGATGSFSRSRYVQHREYNALLGTAAMIAALAAKILWSAR